MDSQTAALSRADAEQGRAAAAALAALASRAEDYLARSKSPNTVRAYAADWRDFSAFCGTHGLVPLPALPSALALYLTELAGRVKPSTLSRRLAAISQAHRLAGHESPTESVPVRKLLRGIRRTHGTAVVPKRPLLVAEILAILEKLPPTPIGARDRLILLIGFSGALRRSELAALDCEDIEENHEGLILTIRRGKTDPEAEGRKVGIPRGREARTCPVAALGAWKQAAGIGSGPLFRRVDRHGRVLSRMSDQTVALVVKRRSAMIGLEASELAGHSLRAGLATSAAIAGKSERAIMQQTGHRSVHMVRRYIRDGSLFRDNAAAGLGF